MLLLDEPLSNLDAPLRASARAEIRRVQAEIGVTTIHVTHDQEEALLLGHRVAVMCEGRVVQAATPDRGPKAGLRPCSWPDSSGARR